MGFADSSLCDGFVCYWRIQSFDIFKPNQSNILRSQVFESAVLGNSKWHLEISQKNNDSLNIYLLMDEGENIHVKCSFYMLTTKSWISAGENKSQKFNIRSKETKAESSIQLQKGKKEKWEYLINGTLLISGLLSKVGTVTMSAQCLIQSQMVNEKEISHSEVDKFQTLKPSDWMYFTPSNILKGSNGTTVDEQKAKVIEKKKGDEDLEEWFSLFKENKFSFVTLQTASRDFVVLRAVLCAQSPIFKAMLKTNIKVMKLDEIENDTLSLMLNFLHQGVLEDVKWDEVTKLFYAAKKYQISLLVEKCIYGLKDRISKETVCKAFIFANLNQIEELSRSAENYFCHNFKIVLLSNEWKIFILNETKLASEILYKMADKLSI